MTSRHKPALRTGPLVLAAAPPDDPLATSDRVFVLRGKLGQGGFGEVYRAFDPRLLRHTALKVLDPDAVHPQVLHAFLEEVRIAGQLDHPHSIPVYETGSDARGTRYASLKLVEGDTLGDRIDALGPSRLDPDPLAELVRAVARACDALAYAHSLGVVHCDLKPSNVLLGQFGEVYVADWGSAFLLGDASVATVSDGEQVQRQVGGTPAYLSPEQALGDPDRVGPHTDVWGLGALLYALLCGRPPYAGTTPADAVYRAVTANFPPILELAGDRAPAGLVAICERAMALRPEDRYPSVVDLRDDLRQFLRGTWSMPVRCFEAGELVIRQGDRGCCAYVVESGTLEVFAEEHGHRLELRRLGPGDVFGEMAILGGGLRSASVRALTPVRLTEVSAEALQQGLGLHGWLGTFVTALADRFRDVDHQLRALRGEQLRGADRDGGSGS